ncbi:MAG: hypothetical protein SFX73_00950 [Kofleriaceae bacterium]|nr:hypothetical protein [Kofleriaceae bacterium]
MRVSAPGSSFTVGRLRVAATCAGEASGAGGTTFVVTGGGAGGRHAVANVVAAAHTHNKE